MSERTPLVEILIGARAADPERIERAIVASKSAGKRLSASLVADGIVEESVLIRAISDRLGIPSIRLEHVDPPPNALRKIPSDMARRFGVLPIALRKVDGGDRLYVAMGEPLVERDAIELREHVGCPVEWVVTSPSGIDAAIERQYEASARPPAATTEATQPPPTPRPRAQGRAPIAARDQRPTAEMDAFSRPRMSTAELEDNQTIEFAPDSAEIARLAKLVASGATDRLDALPSLAVMDDGSEATVEVDLDGEHADFADAIRAMQAEASLALEVPMSFDEFSSPFDGIMNTNLPVGLDTTGFIPVVDFGMDEGFEPPPLDAPLFDEAPPFARELDDQLDKPTEAPPAPLSRDATVLSDPPPHDDADVPTPILEISSYVDDLMPVSEDESDVSETQESLDPTLDAWLSAASGKEIASVLCRVLVRSGVIKPEQILEAMPISGEDD